MLEKLPPAGRRRSLPRAIQLGAEDRIYEEDKMQQFQRFTFLALAALLLATAFGIAQEKGGTEPDMAALMQAMQPGPHHKAMDLLAGKWDVTVRFWPAPGSPPQETKAEMEIKWILGGRFLQTDFKADFGGMQVAGLGLSGYDNIRKKHFYLWMDDMSTGPVHLEGTCAENCKTITTTGDYPDPSTGKMVKLRSVTRCGDKDKYFSELYTIGSDGKEFLMMEMTGSRKKD
jgi:hypothetical protein